MEKVMEYSKPFLMAVFTFLTPINGLLGLLFLAVLLDTLFAIYVAVRQRGWPAFKSVILRKGIGAKLLFYLGTVILAFLIIVLSIQTKLGMKVNILVDRALELWNGPSSDDSKQRKRNVRTSSPMSQHAHSQADYLDDSAIQRGTFPPAPVATTNHNSMMGSYDHMMQPNARTEMNGGMMNMGPAAANGVLGGAFGSAF